jgi:division/cell wall cluster transcriptional repressor MraZ
MDAFSPAHKFRSDGRAKMAEKIKRDPDLDLLVNRHEPVRLDDKGRISLQKEIRDALGSDVILVCDVSKVMRMYPASVFDKIQKDAKKRFSADNASANYYFIAVYSNARLIEVDSANRISIPADLRKFAGLEIKEDCVVIASGREFMVLSGSAYKSYLESPVKFMSSQRDDLETLRKKAFEEEEELRRLERLLSPGQ